MRPSRPNWRRCCATRRRSRSSRTNLFNPAIGGLIALWGFHADTPQSRVPDAAAIAGWVKRQPRMGDLHIEHNAVWSDNPAVQLDLGGYAKGRALDDAVTILKQHGIQNALVNIGGNVIALGQHGDRPWRVGIQHPRKAGTLATLDLRDGEAIGTSGDYQRYFEVGGQRYCHLIDPRSGWPASGMQSVTILAARCTRGHALGRAVEAAVHRRRGAAGRTRGATGDRRLSGGGRRRQNAGLAGAGRPGFARMLLCFDLTFQQ